MLILFRECAEYLSGSRDDAPEPLKRVPVWLARIAVWLPAILLIYFFCGQASKFIYIDF